MTQYKNGEFDTLLTPVMLEVNHLCQDFEKAWRAGQSPRIEDFVGRIGKEGRTAALRELIALQVDLVRAAGQAVEPEEFHSRFPQDAQTVHAAFALIVRRGPENAPAVDGATKSHKAESAQTPIPEKLGRFKIERELGRGTFGVVYLARDVELGRLVALKVSSPKRFSSPEEMNNLIKEAETAAQLRHPGIVTIFELGRDGEVVFIVQEYIDGRDLRKILSANTQTPPFAQAARLMATIAEAVAFAHAKGFIHRDLKPANILLDAQEHPYVADFGLAVHETVQRRRRGERAGSPAYMSPEQVRRETHRLDGRSDIWSLGVILYELLTGRRPFDGDNNELFEEIQYRDPKPPRQIAQNVPDELERICLKCLSKRITDRYSTALDLASDLQHWLASSQQPAVAGSASAPVQVVPKGLRSFDEADAGFFLELLPGPRNRDGLPESIRFWKTHMEETDPDLTFPVGLVYGPSGCGKSSLMKAGLLPRLAAQVLKVYVEATAEDTEVRILKGMRKVCDEIPANATLPEAFFTLREGILIPHGKKFVIVLDQFEQWLHAHRGGAGEQLIQALRQCDGGRLQAVVMVRDDFAMAAARFMDSLDIPIVQGHNFATVDLFDVDHAQNVLTKFGQAFGKLPAHPTPLSAEELEFVSAVATGLARAGKVVSVRLALFAEMVKSKVWIPTTLTEVGGTEGIGVNFLEETFVSRLANPTHRQHQQAARNVLKTLLPAVGTDIKGNMRSNAALLEVSGYADQPKKFDALLRILDGEIRLITPTDPDGKEEGVASSSSSYEKYYQLTHDYLVPSLRDWLTRKQKETRKGRAELRLAERSATWNAKPERRYLPSLWEYLGIVGLTPRTNWTQPQRKMMQAAGRFHGLWAAGISLLLAIATVSGLTIRHSILEQQNVTRAQGLVDTLVNAEIGQVPDVVSELADYRQWADPMLRRENEQAGTNSRQKLHTALALLPVDELHVPYLRDQLLLVSSSQFPVVRDALLPKREQLVEPLWKVALDEKQPIQSRFQAASALATYAPEDKRWGEVDKLVAEHLVTLQASDLVVWREALRPAKTKLIKPLGTIYRDTDRREQHRVYATEILADFAVDQPAVLVGLLVDAERFQFPSIFEKLDRSKAIPLALAEVTVRPSETATEEEKERVAIRQANAAVALVMMRTAEKAWPLFKHTADPRARSYFIHWLAPLGAEPRLLIERLDDEPEVSIRRALVLTLGEFDESRLPFNERPLLVKKLLQLYETEPDAGMHAAVEWLLRIWGEGASLQAVVERLRANREQRSAPPRDEKRNWYVNSQGQTMVILDAGEFLMGSPPAESHRLEDIETQHRRNIGRRFAIAAHEVTKAQFGAFQAERLPEFRNVNTAQWVKSDDSPQTAMTWYEATAYCNWLSQKDGLTEDQWFYETNAEKKYAAGMKAKAKAGQLLGYRLPSEAEWEFACRAGSVTSRYYGSSEELLPKYAWHLANGRYRVWPVGSLKPNDFGLFDMLGNAFELSHTPYKNYPNLLQRALRPAADSLFEAPVTDNTNLILRGGSFDTYAQGVRSANRNDNHPLARIATNGFRVARTFP